MLDRIDEKILRLLQENAKITNIDLAKKINLSPTACLARVKKLEASGIISGYKAVIDPEMSGYNISGLVLIRLSNNTRDAGHAFSKAINKLSCVTECHIAAGKIDYIARVYARDFKHYEHIIRDELATLPHIASMETLFLLSDIIKESSFKFSDII